jgi:hypothetical protein
VEKSLVNMNPSPKVLGVFAGILEKRERKTYISCLYSTATQQIWQVSQGCCQIEKKSRGPGGDSLLAEREVSSPPPISLLPKAAIKEFATDLASLQV